MRGSRSVLLRIRPGGPEPPSVVTMPDNFARPALLTVTDARALMVVLTSETMLVVVAENVLMPEVVPTVTEFRPARFVIVPSAV